MCKWTVLDKFPLLVVVMIRYLLWAIENKIDMIDGVWDIEVVIQANKLFIFAYDTVICCQIITTVRGAKIYIVLYKLCYFYYVLKWQLPDNKVDTAHTDIIFVTFSHPNWIRSFIMVCYYLKVRFILLHVFHNFSTNSVCTLFTTGKNDIIHFHVQRHNPFQ